MVISSPASLGTPSFSWVLRYPDRMRFCGAPSETVSLSPTPQSCNSLEDHSEHPHDKLLVTLLVPSQPPALPPVLKLVKEALPQRVTGRLGFYA